MQLRRHVVVVGGGFAGLSITQSLLRAPVHITLLDRSNHFLFQPLLYLVAMAGLAPAEIAVPIRSVLSQQRNVQVLLAEVTGVDFQSRKVYTRECLPLEYDYLVLAPGLGVVVSHLPTRLASDHGTSARCWYFAGRRKGAACSHLAS
jgi:NADH dehydrogenase FAD-containing subunit